MRQPQRDARQARRPEAAPPDGGGIDVRELTDADLARADAVLPLHRLDGDGSYLVAWDGEQPVGHAHIAWSRTKLGVPEIQDVFVLPERRDRGIGSQLTLTAEQRVAGRGHGRVSIGVSVANPDARRLYERLGYTDAGLAPQRVRGTITVRGKPFEVDDTILYLHKELAVDPGSARSS